jgi:hypothetical protein
MKPEQMVFDRWYVVDLAYREHNPIHRAIAFEARDGACLIIGGGYGPEIVHWQPLPHFRIIREIEEMRAESSSHALSGEP